MRTRTTLLAAALLVSVASAAQAQDPFEYRRPTGGHGGVSLFFAQPQGEFGDVVDQGWGGGLHYIHAIDAEGLLGIRVDGSFINYGHERQEVRLSPTVGDRIRVDLTTSNNIAFLGLGPQVGAPVGVLRPYAHGFVGVSYIFTSSALSGVHDDEAFGETTNYDDASFAYGGGAGLYIPVRRGVAPISIDAGLTYRKSGEARYLVEGGIIDNPDGSITLNPIQSDTDLLVFHLGVSIGIAR